MSENMTEADRAAEAPEVDTTVEAATPPAADPSTDSAATGDIAGGAPSSDEVATSAEAVAAEPSGDVRTDDDSTEDAEDAQDAENTGDAQDAVAAPRRGVRREQLEREGEVAADFLETLLDICDLDGDLDVDIDGDRAAVAIVDSDEGRVPRRLVGQDGQVLEALQELTRLAVQSQTGERSRLMLDVAGHRAGRRAELVRLASDAIASVRASGEPAALEPMSAFERKVVHDEVLAAGLRSESEGSEPRRHVVISPA